MAKNDIPPWTIVGLVIGLLATSVVNKEYILIGGILGGLIGYFLGKIVR